METEIINLRPHHLNTVAGYLRGLIDLALLYKSPEDAGLRRSTQKFFTASNLLRKIYRGSAWNMVGEIAHGIGNNPDIFIRLVQGGDDICGMCIFAEKCLRGDYREVTAALKSEGLTPQKTSDEEVLKQWKRGYGDIVRAKELFEIS